MKKTLFTFAFFAILGLSSTFAQITISISASTNPICPGNPTTLNASGAISYLWNGGSTVNPMVVAPTATTTYTVTGTSIINTGSASITITVDNPAINISASANPIVAGDTTILTASGAITYIWSGGLGTSNPVKVSPSATTTYMVTGYDAIGCSGVNSITIILSLSDTISSHTDVSCHGGSNGTATVTVYGGTPAYTYLWSTSPAQTTQTATGLSVGNYIVTITDHAANTVTASVVITQPTALMVSILSSANVSCFGGNNGSATVGASGGTPPYASYVWDDGETSQTAVSLNQGVHSVTVTDANGCTGSTSAIITQPTAITISFTVDSVKCYGLANGSITANASGGTPPYSYTWNTTPVQTTATITGLTAGSYWVTVTDNNGCKDSMFTYVLQPTQMISFITSSDTILPCFNINNGTVTIAVVGGTAPWTFHWNTGSTGMTINSLSGGVYTDTITDHKGCRNIHSVTVTQPTDISIQIDSINPSCMNACDGQLSALVMGGTPFSGVPYYHYLWNTTPPQYTDSITGLCQGTYNLTVTDSNLCHKIVSIYISTNDSLNASFKDSSISSSSPWLVIFTYTGAVFASNIYTWHFGDGHTSNLENPTHTYTTYATYDVWLNVTIIGCGTDSVHTFIGPASLGKNNTAINDLISIYPNPVTDNLQLETALQIKDIEISDITGRLLFTTTSKTIDCSDFAGGVYFIRVITEKGIAVKKFVKE